MPQCHAEGIATIANPTQLLRRLSRHFSHKLHCQWRDAQSCIWFEFGRCEMRGVGDQLRLRCDAQAEHHLREIIDTLDRHIAVMAGAAAKKVQWRYNLPHTTRH